MANPIDILTVSNFSHTSKIGMMAFSNTLGSSLTSLEAAITSVDTGQVICAFRSVNKAAKYYTFNFTEAEIDKFIALVPYNMTTAPIRYHLQYVYNGQTYRESKDATFTINSNAATTLLPIAYDTFADTVRLTGDENTIIRGYSVVYANANPTFYYGALQAAQSITNGSRVIGLSSAYIDNPQSGTFTFSVTDSRGYTTIRTIEKNFIDYTYLTCTIKADLPTTAGTCELKIQGAFFNDTFGAVDNTLALHYRYKAEGEEYGSWKTVTPTKDGHSYTATVTATGLDYQKRYTFQARAMDELATVLSNEDTVRAQPVFDWDKDDFNFNVPITASTINTLDVLGAANLRLTAEKGAATLSADTNVNLNSGAGVNYGVRINGFDMCKNKVLWSGAGYAMTTSHTVNLSAGVDKQPHGIVLVFSYYNGSAAEDAHFCSFFVPKEFVSSFSGAGMVFNLRRHMVIAPATKYLYITNTKITGHANNSETGTANQAAGINWANNSFVLRRVIGV